ncbi:uncharacterized protein LOC118488123 [Helianthus annuus]|uniref:uncharacterized protein LOC118488123 n=1 Tax=Helianthus annuus TaxID=4232 RepID=UPI0016533C07|nr:uncharacterized protein LOC118488123 [Helianthus annuus]
MVVAYGGCKTKKERGDETERQRRGRTSGGGCDRSSPSRTGGSLLGPAVDTFIRRLQIGRRERERNEMKRERATEQQRTTGGGGGACDGDGKSPACLVFLVRIGSVQFRWWRLCLVTMFWFRAVLVKTMVWVFQATSRVRASSFFGSRQNLGFGHRVDSVKPSQLSQPWST